MAITPSDFSKIWASNADTPEYTFSDANYQKGWDFVGNLPPTRAMWNAMQKSTDEKMKYVFDNFGAPLTASTVAGMTMQNRVYVYTGNETGYTAGHWYYWNGSAWTDGGVYNSNTVQVDPTLTISGAAADAKVTGEKINTVIDVLNISDIFPVNKNVNNEEVVFFDGIDLKTGDTVLAKLTNAISTTVYLRIYDGEGTRITAQSINAGNTEKSYTVYSNYENAKITIYTNATGVNATVSITQANPEPNEIQRLTSEVNEINDTIPAIINDTIEDEYLDYGNNARYNADDAVVGKYVNPDSGALKDNATEFTTDYLPIRPNETLYTFRVGSMQARKIDFYACYDKDKNYVQNSGGSNVYSVTQSGNVAFVRMSFLYNTEYYVQRPEGLFVVPTDKPYYCQQIDADPVVNENYLPRKTVYVYATDTEQQVIEKFVNAYKRGNCDLLFERAHYAFGTVLPNVKTLYKLNENEIPIGNGCRYFFNGSTLTAEIDLATLGTDFYCNLLGSQRFPSSYELYDGILISTDTRYVVHDEASGYSATYRRVYRNMEMHYITNLRTDGYRKCIGGGTGKNGVVDIDGCKFTVEGEGLVQDVSYHGCIPDVPGSEFYISVKNSWFSQTFAESTLGETQTAKIHLSGNSFGRPIIEYQRWEKTYFNNEIRS